jgi:hypothetical protein
MKKRDDRWEEFTVYVETPHLPGHKIPMCGLCGNTGIVDTTGTATTPVGNVFCGIRAYCICPNGRAMKEHGDPL